MLAWIAQDPDPAARAELTTLLEASTPAAEADLEDRFAGRLHFGTAGLRGPVAAGPNRMNRAVVRGTTAALAAFLEEKVAGAKGTGVVIGCDARHGSSAFAEEAAQVLAGAGFAVRLLPQRLPTPLLAYSTRRLGAAAGVMITASHNPPADNGYKLYLGDGAQIVPPVDAEIEALTEEVGPLGDIPVAEVADSSLVEHLGREIVDDYLDELARHDAAPPGAESLRIVYTPLHGVARRTFEAALARAGFPAPVVVAAQAEPDPDFPTVAFPNPEEPGALDLAVAEAARIGADVVLANDPDGDRLAVAVPDATAPGGWRTLTGDQLGSLLGAHVLDAWPGRREGGRDGRRGGEGLLVATTIVSSSLLGKIAAASGVAYIETLTGFKWIARSAEQVPGSRFVYGYEEALGYGVGEVVRDKDGIGASLAFLGLVTAARQEARSVLDLLDELEIGYGVHLTAQRSIRSRDPGAQMAALRRDPPSKLGGRAIVGTHDYAGGPGGRPLDGAGSAPAERAGSASAERAGSASADRAGGPPAGGIALPPSDVLAYHLDGARVTLRPSGTEPKLKIYFEV
ncbi:MAG: phospho-sugar mutase, partial [Acidimicrobiales bacterium]